MIRNNARLCRIALFAAFGASLAACSDDGVLGLGGDESGYCVGSLQGGSTSWSCTSCSGLDPLDDNEDFAPAIDDKASTWREFSLGQGGSSITITAHAPADTAFPAGVDPGALIRFPEGTFASIGVSFNTYREGAPVDVQSGGATGVAGSVEDAGTPTYYSLTPIGEFDTVEAVITVSGNAEPAVFRVYEFCGDK